MINVVFPWILERKSGMLWNIQNEILHGFTGSSTSTKTYANICKVKSFGVVIWNIFWTLQGALWHAFPVVGEANYVWGYYCAIQSNSVFLWCCLVCVLLFFKNYWVFFSETLQGSFWYCSGCHKNGKNHACHSPQGVSFFGIIYPCFICLLICVSLFLENHSLFSYKFCTDVSGVTMMVTSLRKILRHVAFLT